MQTNLITVIVTSAGVSAFISGIFLLLNDYLRRRSEEKRFIVETAIRLTKMRDEQTGEILKRTSKKVLWPSPLNTFEKTLKIVTDIWNNKHTPQDKPPLET